MGVWRSWFPLSVKEKMDLLEPMVGDNVLSDDEIKKLKNENVISDYTANHTNEIRTDLVRSFLPVFSGKDQKIPQSDQMRAAALVSKIFLSRTRNEREYPLIEGTIQNDSEVIKIILSSLSQIPDPLLEGLKDFFKIPDGVKCFIDQSNEDILPLCSTLKRDPSILKDIFKKYTFQTQNVFEKLVLSVGPIAIKPLFEVYLETKNNLLISLLTKLVKVPCSFDIWSGAVKLLEKHKENPSLKDAYLALLLNVPQFESSIGKESKQDIEGSKKLRLKQQKSYQEKCEGESVEMLNAFLRGVINLSELPKTIGDPLEASYSVAISFSNLYQRYQSEKDLAAKQKLLTLLQKKISENPVCAVFSELHRIEFPESLLPDELKDPFFFNALKMGSFSPVPEDKKLLLEMMDRILSPVTINETKNTKRYLLFFEKSNDLELIEMRNFLQKSHRRKFNAFIEKINSILDSNSKLSYFMQY